MLRIIGPMIRRRRPRAQTKNGRIGAVEYDLVRCEYPSAVRSTFAVVMPCAPAFTAAATTCRSLASFSR
jgi:hypothetical protein